MSPTTPARAAASARLAANAALAAPRARAALPGRRLLVLCASALLGACASTHGLAPQGHLAAPEQLASAQSLAAAPLREGAWPAERWWTVLGDHQLDQLMDEALAGSPSLRVAEARTRQALGAATVAGSGRYPQADFAAASTRELFPGHALIPPPYGGNWYTLNDVHASLDWDLDFFGRERARHAQALDAARASQLEEQAARIALTTAIAHAYVQLQYAYLQRDVAQSLFDERQQIFSLTRQRNDAGIDSRLELKQAESVLPESREQIAQLDEQIGLARNALAALLGAGPDRGRSLERPNMAAFSSFALPSRLPALLLGRRPDILALRWRVESAARGIDLARAQFYPDVSLTALIGLQSLGTSAFAAAANRAVAVGPALTLPLFDAGRRRGELASRDAQYDAAVAQYDQSLADALREVVDQITVYQSLATQAEAQRAGLSTAQQAYELALLRYREGLGNYLQVLTTHQQLLAQRSLEAELRARALDVGIDLARSLGGGFQAQPAQAAAATPRTAAKDKA